MVICFDVDGTLITFDEKPKWIVIDILRQFYALGVTIYVHSGGGQDYAEHWVRRLCIGEFVTGAYCKGDVPEQIDVAFDDEPVTFGKVNIQV